MGYSKIKSHIFLILSSPMWRTLSNGWWEKSKVSLAHDEGVNEANKRFTLQEALQTMHELSIYELKKRSDVVEVYTQCSSLHCPASTHSSIGYFIFKFLWFTKNIYLASCFWSDISDEIPIRYVPPPPCSSFKHRHVKHDAVPLLYWDAETVVTLSKRR